MRPVRVKLRIVESSNLLRKLCEIDLLDRIKVLLHDATNANTTTGSPAKHNYIYNYLTAKDWEVLCTNRCMNLCVKTLLRRCALIGRKSPWF